MRVCVVFDITEVRADQIAERPHILQISFRDVELEHKNAKIYQTIFLYYFCFVDGYTDFGG